MQVADYTYIQRLNLLLRVCLLVTITKQHQADVLVVDDTPHNIQLLEFMLEDAGYRVISTNSGSTAIELAQEKQPKLILLDVMMPGMDGFEACRQLKANPLTEDIPVIFVTAKATENDETIGFEAGGVDYITKPVNEAVVLARVKTHLELKSYRESLESIIEERTQTLNNTLRELARSNKIKDEFLATISHELRTPLNGISGSLYLLQETGLNVQQKNLLEVTKQSTADLSARVESILVLTEAIAGTLRLSPEIMTLRSSITSLIDRIKRFSEFKNIQISSSVADDVPDLLYTDAEYLKRILGHLLANALKFTERGYIELSIKLSNKVACASDAVCVDFSVRDSGIGIAANKQAEIFELFRQGESSFNRRFGGLGIGLSICQSLIKLMGGKLELHSEENRGSEFTASIPLPLATPESNQAKKPSNKSSTQRTLSVLIVEDNVINQMVEKGIVEKNGHRVFTAANGKEALALLEQETIDIVLMDCQMPIMDGFETTRHLRASNAYYKNIPIIAVTANASAIDRERCFNAGMDDYLAKPVNTASLKTKLLKWSRSQK